MSFPGNSPIDKTPPQGNPAPPPQASRPNIPNIPRRQLPPVPLFSAAAPVLPASSQRPAANISPSSAAAHPQPSEASARDPEQPIRQEIYAALKNPHFDLHEVLGKLRHYLSRPLLHQEQKHLECLILGHYFSRRGARLMEAYDAHAAVFLSTPFSQLSSESKKYTLYMMSYMTLCYILTPQNIDLDMARPFLSVQFRMQDLMQDNSLDSFRSILFGYLKRENANPFLALRFTNNFSQCRRLDEAQWHREILQAYLNNPSFSPKIALQFIQQMNKPSQQEGLQKLFDALSTRPEDLTSILEIARQAPPNSDLAIAARNFRSSSHPHPESAASSSSSEAPVDACAVFPLLNRREDLNRLRQEITANPNFSLREVFQKLSQPILFEGSNQIQQELVQLALTHYLQRREAHLIDAYNACMISSYTQPQFIKVVSDELVKHLSRLLSEQPERALEEIRLIVQQLSPDLDLAIAANALLVERQNKRKQPSDP